MAEMTKNDAALLAAVKTGRPVLFAEFRLAKAEEIKYKSKKTGQDETLSLIRFTVEGETDSYPVTEYLPAGSTIKDWKCPYTKGEKVLVIIAGFFTEKGQTNVRGTIQRLSAV